MHVRMIPWARDHNLVPAPTSDAGLPLLSLHRQINRIFDDVFSEFDRPLTGGSRSEWPRVEVSETDKTVTVRAELPGLTESDVEVTLQDEVLTLGGEKKVENHAPRYSDLWYGRFERALHVGDVNPDKVAAAFKNGVLTVTLEKRPEAQARVKRIAINGRS